MTLAALLLFASCVSRDQSTISEQQLTVSPQVTLAGSLTPTAIAQLREQPALVIDLRTSEEAGQAEEQLAMRRAGIVYQQLPLSGAAVTAQQAQAFAQLLSAHPDAPVIVHCASGNRAALLWAAYRITLGDSLTQAESAVAPLATKEATVDAIRAFTRSVGTPED